MSLMRGLAVAVLLLTIVRVHAEETPQTLYMLYCSGCHGANGVGNSSAHVPPLAYTGPMLDDPDGRRYIVNVAGVLTSTLNERDTATVLNWIKQQFAEPASSARPDFDEKEIRELRAQRPADVVGLRRQIAERLRQRGVEIPGYPWP